MNKNEIKLLEILINTKEVIKANELSLLLGVSTKSIRNYVSEINKIKKCIYSTNKGYTVDRELAVDLLHIEYSNDLPETKNERVSYMLMKLLKKSNASSINLQDFCDQLFISYETVKKDFIDVKEKLLDYNIFVRIEKDDIYVEGSEKQKRKMLSSLLCEEFTENVLSIDSISKIFPKINIPELADDIRENTKKHGFFINEYALVNLILELSIGMDRIMNNFIHISRHAPIKHPENSEVNLANELVNIVEKKYNIEYSESEFEEFSNTLISSLTKMDYLKIKMDDLSNLIDEEDMQLVNQLLDNMKAWDYFDLSNEGFIVKFALHIKNLRRRILRKYELKNPLTQNIKMSCPLIFEHAVELSNQIKQFTQSSISDHETAFLALHIGNMIRESNFINEQIKCVLLFPQYYDYSDKLVKSINAEFENEMVISYIVTNDEKIDWSKFDLLISTIPSNDLNCDIPKVQITPFLTRNDKLTISNEIEKINLSRKRDFLKNNLLKITDKNLFFKNKTMTSKKDIIYFICDEMRKNGCVDGSYVDEVLERENESSTAFGKIAIPHSFNMDAKKTNMFVFLSEKPIQWDENQVNIVLLFAVKHNERSIFFNVFDNLVVQLLEPTNLNLVMKSESITDFVDNFVKCLKSE
ncbi:lichenan operon transcriptional antiterminator [Breznakia sp. PF5-3]|uniref:BglG family transcription antiterminator n=1 Tax=unclassified Breznakia TaxID=2623764 RepID=UPI0024070981|nr:MULTISPECIES: PTS sugar transporter subunit IIA [unclassified Breznakia]MDF9825709.1 lichenan operon transcriptional antiterminator [Breznakia sp. PM6-1]MDF9836529.1 lichenan operon transcriptional antiterminator [Breznakia sp. PF5-3]MDF9838763.1 lichenan operon transcriptional antiterminator [Breznakia sp. PFB2-8]MDF9860789.1 lichenan operon transcriptional antiterminator [Breznakia sp. PH5-24]